MRRAGKWVAGLTAALLVLALLAVGGLAWMRDRTLPAGDLITRWVEDRAGAAVGDGALTFGGLRLGLTGAGRPQIVMQDARLVLPDAGEILSVSEMRVDLGRAALLEGRLSLIEVVATGAQVQLRRDADGRFELALGEAAAPVEDANSFADLLQQIDATFNQAELVELRSATLRNATVFYRDEQSDQSWTGDGGRLTFTRGDTGIRIAGDLAVLTGGADLAGITMSYERNSVSGTTVLSATLDEAAAGDIASQSPALAWMSVLDAPISGFLRADITNDGLGPLNATLEIGAGVLKPTRQTRAVPFAGAKSYFTYVPRDGRLDFRQVAVDSDWGRLSGSGTAYLGQIEAGLPQEIIGQFQLPELEVNPDQMFDGPVALQQASVDFRMVLDPFTVTIGEAVLFHGTSRGLLRGVVAGERDGWRVAMDGHIDETTPEQVLALWPPALAPKSRGWVADNLRSGRLHNVSAVVRAAGQNTPVVALTHEFEGAEIKALRNLPAITDAAGTFSLFDNRMSAQLDHGQFVAPQGGRVDVAGTAFVIEDITKRPSSSVVHLATDSTITAALSVLDADPFNLLRKADQSTQLADGRAQVSGKLRFPLVPKVPAGAFGFDVKARLAQVRSNSLVPGRTLSASTLDLTATPEALAIEGNAQLDQLPVLARWTQPLGQGQPAQVVGRFDLTNAALDTFGIRLPSGSLRGQAEAQFALELPKGAAPSYRVESGLSGLTLSIPSVGWTKPAGSAGDFAASGRLGARPTVDAIRLEGAGLSAQGGLRLAQNGRLEAVDIAQLRVGSWLSGAMTLTTRGRGQPPAIALRNGQLDLRTADFAAPGGGAGPPLDLELDILRVSEQIALTGFRGAFAGAAGLSGEFSGRVNGGTRVSGTIEPGAEGPVIRLVGDDAGAAIRDAGIFEKITGGDLALTLNRRSSPGVFDGVLALKNIRVRDAPEMAALLSAISVVGLLEQLDGQGLVFSNVDARFRLTPAQLIVTQSSAVGPSLGLSLDGLYALGTKVFDMQGVISPLYLVNGIGSILTRRGEGLIGFNFTLRGPSDNPRVGVNPLSVLTPGMFREIFRRPPPKVTQ